MSQILSPFISHVEVMAGEKQVLKTDDRKTIFEK